MRAGANHGRTYAAKGFAVRSRGAARRRGVGAESRGASRARARARSRVAEGGRRRPSGREPLGRYASRRASRSVSRQPPPVSRRSLRFLSLVFQALIFSTADPSTSPFRHFRVHARVHTPLINVAHLSNAGPPLCSPFSPPPGLPPTTNPDVLVLPSRLRSSGLRAESIYRAVSMSIRGRRPSLPSAPRTLVRRCA